MIRWSLATLRNCTAERYRVNKTRMVRLAEYSRDCLRALRAATGIAYDERLQGTLQLFRTQKQFDGSAGDVAVLRQSGVAFELLDRDGCIRHEPALARVREKFVGGLLLPGDETGDCFKFTQRLAELARERGVDFRFATTIARARAQRRAHRRRRHRTRRRSTPTPTWSRSAAIHRCCLRPIGIRIPGLSGQGLFDHAADRRRRRRARVDGDGRDAQGRGDAARRSDPCRRHRRARRLHAALHEARRKTLATSSATSFPVAATSRARSSGAA